MQQDLSEGHEAKLDETTVILPPVQRRGVEPAEVKSAETHGPRPHRPATDRARTARARRRPRREPSEDPSPARPAGDEDNAPPYAADGADLVQAGRGTRRTVAGRRGQPVDGDPTRLRRSRVRGKHAAMSRRQRWERRYVRALVLCDLLPGWPRAR